MTGTSPKKNNGVFYDFPSTNYYQRLHGELF